MIEKLKIGTKLFQRSSPNFLEYEIIEIQEFKTKNHIEKFFIVECKSCRDHENCVVALKINERKENLIYSHMINEDEEEPQYYWHKNENQKFFLTKKDAVDYFLIKCIEDEEKSIEKEESSIKERKTRIEEYKTRIDTLKL